MMKPYFAAFSLLLLAACGGGGGGGTTPVAAPPVVPTPVLGTLAVTPVHVALSAPGATQSVSATQTNFSGQFTASADAASCSGVASLQQTVASASFTIVAGQTPGVCKMSIGGGGGQSVAVDVTVTITQGGIH
jgi:hypothetical protein